jgi:mevalonate kinase
MIEQPDPWDLLLQCISAINTHSEQFQQTEGQMEHSKKVLSELLKQNQMLLKNIRVMNQSIKLINQRLSNLEKQNDTE